MLIPFSVLYHYIRCSCINGYYFCDLCEQCGARKSLRDLDGVVFVGFFQLGFLLDLQICHLLFGEREHEEEQKGHQAEEDGGDQGGHVVHLLQILQGLDSAFFILVVHAQQSAVDADGGDHLTQLAEEVEEGVGGAVVAAARLYFDVVDGVRGHAPQLQHQGGEAASADEAKDQEDEDQSGGVGVSKEEQDEVCQGGDRHAPGADFFFAQLLCPLGHEEHHDDHGGVGAGHGSHVHPVGVEIVVEEI